MAGWSDQDVFVKELNGGLGALEQSIGMDRGAIHLVNHADTVESLPVANRTNFAAAVRAIGRIMNKDEDVLLLFMTSHGSPSGVGLVFTDMFHSVLSPDDVASVLDREGIRNRLLIVSACYSGVFVSRLASPDTVILTASDADNPSFGCSNERDWTYFGDAFFNLNLRPGVAFEEAFEKAKSEITKWEVRDGMGTSNPQGFFGASLTGKLNLSTTRRAAAVDR
jgi:Peptidase C13 family